MLDTDRKWSNNLAPLSRHHSIREHDGTRHVTLEPVSPTNGAVSFSRFLREVTRFAPSGLLEALAREGSIQTLRHRDDPRSLIDRSGWLTPWGIIEIARESIVHGIQGGQPPPSREAVRRLGSLFNNLDDPMAASPMASLDRFLVRVGFEQARWQLSEFEELARPHALLVEAAARVPSASAFSDASWRAALGCSLDEFVAIGFFLFVWASQHEGWIDLNWMELPNFAPVRERYPSLVVDEVVRRRLAATFDEFRQMDPVLDRGRDAVPEHRFNPLTARPLVQMRDARLLAPHPLLLLHRIGVNGLYYDRVNDPDFTNQLGPVFEAYVGMQLELVAGATVHPEVQLDKSRLSVDWIVILPEVVVLVEAKATRLTELARAGLDRLDEDRDRTLGKAYTQIEETARLISERHPKLEFVPTDRPVRGLVVTLEPYWNAVSGFGPAVTTTVPTTVASVREVEHFAAVGQTDDVAPALLSMSDTHSNNALLQALGSFPNARNPILERAWDAIFGDEPPEGE